MKLNAIILAAGLGKRLRPITDRIPKPLIPIGKYPLLANIISGLNNAGVANFAVNGHWQHEKIQEFIKTTPWKNKIRFYCEPEILGTGGPVINASYLLRNSDAFVLHNGDIFCDINYEKLFLKHQFSGNDITMVLADGHENKVLCDDENVYDILNRIGVDKKENMQLKTYCGIAVFNKKIFEYLPEKPSRCSIIDAVIEMLRHNPVSVGAFRIEHSDWHDMGRPSEYFNVMHKIKKREDLYKNKKKIPNFKDYNFEFSPEQGSGRYFAAVKTPYTDDFIMISNEKDKDFERFISYGEFFYENNLHTPEIKAYNKSNYTVTMENLGSESLFDACKNRKPPAIMRIYKKTIDNLIDFQLRGLEKLHSSQTVSFRDFDKNYLLWESSYFKENFLENLLGIEKKYTEKLQKAFDVLADEMLEQPKILMHRDFQSKNIILQNEDPKFIDFQGARIGPFAYDIVSLTHDPYVNMNDEMKVELLKYYFNNLKKQNFPFNRSESAHFANISALHRLMQAIGAFSFLSIIRKKRFYGKYIFPAWQILEKELIYYGNNDLIEISEKINKFKEMI